MKHFDLSFRQNAVWNLIAGFMVEPEGVNLKPEPVLFNSWQEMGTGVCEVGISNTSVAIGKKKRNNKAREVS